MNTRHGPAYRPRSRPAWAVPRTPVGSPLSPSRSRRPFRARYALLLAALIAVGTLCLRLACASRPPAEPDPLPTLRLDGQTTLPGTVTTIWAAPGGGVVQLESETGRVLAPVGVDRQAFPLPAGALLTAAADSDGSLLLAIADPATGEVALVDQAAGVRARPPLPGRTITCCRLLPGGQLVIGLGGADPDQTPALLSIGPDGIESWLTDTDMCATGPAAEADGVLAVAGLWLSSREEPAYLIQALANSTGDIMWRLPMGRQPPHILIARPSGFLVGVGSELLALTSEGKVAWRVDTGSWPRGVYPGEQHIYLVTEEPTRGGGTTWRIHGLDTQGGRRWHRLVDEPLAAGYDPGSEALLLATGGELLALTPAGQVEWRVPIPTVGMPAPARLGGMFVAGNSGGLCLAGPEGDGQSRVAIYRWTGPTDRGAPGRTGGGVTDDGAP